MATQKVKRGDIDLETSGKLVEVKSKINSMGSAKLKRMYEEIRELQEYSKFEKQACFLGRKRAIR